MYENVFRLHKRRCHPRRQKETTDADLNELSTSDELKDAVPNRDDTVDAILRLLSQRQSQYSMGTPEPERIFFATKNLSPRLRARLDLYDSSRPTWLIDWEFVMLTTDSNVCAVWFEGSIYTIRGERIFSSVVRWPNVSKAALADAIRP